MIFFNDKEKFSLISENQAKTEKVASFDLDYTLTKPLDGFSLFNTNENNWQLMDKVLDKMKKYQDDGFTLVIFTNQGHFSDIGKLKRKMEGIFNCFFKHGIHVSIYGSYGRKSTFRKPGIGLWNEFLKDHGKEIKLGESFYCGDAAGREKDFSDSDLVFARHVGIDFYTPELIFN